MEIQITTQKRNGVHPFAVLGSWRDVNNHDAAPLDTRPNDLVQDVVGVLCAVWFGLVDRPITHGQPVVTGQSL